MQLKLRTAAGALAQARADWEGEKTHKEIHPKPFHQVSPDAFTYAQEMPGVEELIPQIVKEVKPDEEEDVDAHPNHL